MAIDLVSFTFGLVVATSIFVICTALLLMKSSTQKGKHDDYHQNQHQGLFTEPLPANPGNGDPLWWESQQEDEPRRNLSGL